jgi:flagellar motor switch protein FliN
MTTQEASPLQKYIDLWKDSFGAVLGQLGVASPNTTFSPPEAISTLPAEELETLIWGRFSVAGALRGELMLLVEKSVALQCAQLLMSEPLNTEASFEDMHRDAFAELLRQVAGQAATFWKQDTSTEIQINFEASPSAPFVPSQSTVLRVTGEKLPELSIRFLLDGDLCAAIAASAPPGATPEPAAASNATNDDPPEASNVPLPQNLELLLDVELEATIRFGEREMLLRDIFGLMPGAVVELTQFVNEPAELLVAGRCIARGEVVVVDGNFGLRVTDVASQGQRAELIQA